MLLINIVQVIANIEGIESSQAKSMAYAWQLFVEDQIMRELKEMESMHKLSLQDWEFVNACLYIPGANMLSSFFVARYGGEKARIISNDETYY